jgi:hypothetical protein
MMANRDAEYPLIPQGVYFANVVDIVWDEEEHTIEWVFSLTDNGGVMNDGTTAVDGAIISAKNWLPKEGDENVLTKSGIMTERQAKVKTFFDFLQDMKCPESTEKQITKALTTKTWVGKRAKLTIGFRTYEGRIFNGVKKAIAV